MIIIQSGYGWNEIQSEFAIHHQMDDLQQITIDYLSHLDDLIEMQFEKLNGFENNVLYPLEFNEIDGMYIFNEMKMTYETMLINEQIDIDTIFIHPIKL